MYCLRRQKLDDIAPEQKWDFISLNDFKSTSCFTPFAYVYLWLSLIISIAVYGVDTFTAVNLLAFDRWSGEIQPVIPFSVSKWIFSACIIASWVNLGYEFLRATYVMRRGAVAESYLDSLAVRLESVRMGRTGRGWRRFLVFAELTKSKKGVEYVALFTYFSFQSWIRIIFCQGPRQVINALTIYSVFNAKLDPSTSKDVGSAFVQFFKNVGVLASSEHQQAVILSGMVFTLVVWIFGALSLLLAGIFYIVFLWHHIPSADGGLTGYCSRKINQRLKSIVSVRINKALEEDERRRMKADAKAAKKGECSSLGRQATVPTLFDSKDDDKLPNMPMLNRNDTTTTLPLYSSRPGTPSSFELGNLNEKRPFSHRTITGSSTTSNAPLINNTSETGYGRAASPALSVRSFETRSPVPRNLTGNYSNPAAAARMPPMSDRPYTPNSNPAVYSSPDPYNRPMPLAVNDLRSNTPMSPPSSYGPAPVYNANAQGYQSYSRSASAGPPRSNPQATGGVYRNGTDPTGYGVGPPTSSSGSSVRSGIPFPRMGQGQGQGEQGGWRG